MDQGPAGNHNCRIMRHFADCTRHFRHVVGINVITGVAADCIYRRTYLSALYGLVIMEKSLINCRISSR